MFYDIFIRHKKVEKMLPSMEKMLMYDDYGDTTCIELWTSLSCIVQPKLTVIDWNTLYKFNSIPKLLDTVY